MFHTIDEDGHFSLPFFKNRVAVLFLHTNPPFPLHIYDSSFGLQSTTRSKIDQDKSETLACRLARWMDKETYGWTLALDALHKELSDTCRRAKVTPPSSVESGTLWPATGPTLPVTLQGLAVLHREGYLYINHPIPAQDQAAH